MIRVISGYRVSQNNTKNAGPLTACQQQLNTLIFNNSPNLNPKQAFLQDLQSFITAWRNKGEHNEVIVLMDANQQLKEKNCLGNFVQSTGLIDIVAEREPHLADDPTYLWGSKRLDYILISPGLTKAVVKVGHHPFHQHIVSDHKGIYAYFLASSLFDTGEIDRSHKSQRRLDLSKRETVVKYVSGEVV